MQLLNKALKLVRHPAKLYRFMRIDPEKKEVNGADVPTDFLILWMYLTPLRDGQDITPGNQRKFFKKHDDGSI